MSDYKTTSLGADTELVIGRAYRIIFADCCIEGHFEGVYLGLHVVDGDAYGLRFDTGLLGPEWASIEYEELS